MPEPSTRRVVGAVLTVSVLAMAAVLLLWQTLDDACRDELRANVGAEACAPVPVADQVPVDPPRPATASPAPASPDPVSPDRVSSATGG